MRTLWSIREAAFTRIYNAALDAGKTDDEAQRLAEIGAAEEMNEVADERAERQRDQRIDDMLTGDRR